MSDKIKTEAKRGVGRPKLDHKHVGVFLDEKDCDRLRRLSAAAGLNKSEYISRLLALADALDAGMVKNGNDESAKVGDECDRLFLKHSSELQAYFGIGKLAEDEREKARAKYEGWQGRGLELGAKMKKKNA